MKLTYSVKAKAVNSLGEFIELWSVAYDPDEEGGLERAQKALDRKVAKDLDGMSMDRVRAA